MENNEQMRSEEFFTESEKQELAQKAIENSNTLEEVVDNAHTLAEESFYTKKTEEENTRIDELKKSILADRATEFEAIKQEPIDAEEHGRMLSWLEKFDEADKKYKYDEDTMIRSVQTLGNREYQHTDKKGAKARLFFGNKRGAMLETLGSLAETVGIDLAEGMKMKDIRKAIEERLVRN